MPLSVLTHSQLLKEFIQCLSVQDLDSPVLLQKRDKFIEDTLKSENLKQVLKKRN